ncbi:MAG: NmrA/HSCARG family protein [Gemmatimonadota bacterium]
MADRKIIAVLGATGAQGGGLARAILDDDTGEFALRAVTRNPQSDKGRALAAEGAEVVRADLDDVASLKRAFDGAYGVFGLTNFWEHFSPAKETQQGRNIAEAAAAAGVKHVVWSTFEDTRKWVPLDDNRMPTLQERYKVPHFDAKAEADSAFREHGVPTTFLYTSFYWDNAINFGTGPKRGEDGVLGLAMPMGDARLPGIAAADIGPAVLGIFKAGDHYIGRTVGVAGEHLTGQQMAQGFARVLGEEVRYHAVPADVYRGFGFPGADDMGNMFQFKRDFNDDYTRVRSVAETRRLNPSLRTFDQWLAENGSRIPRE